jgi:Tol biopolymer transport system component
MNFPRKPSPRALASARLRNPLALLLVLAAAAACALLLGAGARTAAAEAEASAAASPTPPQTGLVGVTPSGGSSIAGVFSASSISADGRFVAFATTSPDISPLDTNGDPGLGYGGEDVFVRDRRAGRTTLVSVNAAGTGSGDAASGSPVITPDGRFVAFLSTARDLVSPDPGGPGFANVYLRDLHTNKTVLVSQSLSGGRGNHVSGNGVNQGPSLHVSADGRYVSFISHASDLVAGDDSSQTDAFVRDVRDGVTHLVSVNMTGTGGGNRGTDCAVMTPDGRFVAFLSESTDLAPSNFTGPARQVFLRDLQAGTTRLVSATHFDGSRSNGSADERHMGELDLSADGRFVAFASNATDLVTGDGNGTDIDRSQDVFVRDTVAGTTRLVSVNAAGTGAGAGQSGSLSMTPDGRFVVFISSADNLVAGDTNNLPDVFLRDVQAGTTALVTAGPGGAAAGVQNLACEFYSPPMLFYPSVRSSVSADGRFVAFRSAAAGLSPTPDTNCAQPFSQNGYDIFVRDMQAGSTRMMSANRTGEDAGARASASPVITPDGRHVLFTSWAEDLVANDTNAPFADIFVGVNLATPGQVRFARHVFSAAESAGRVTVSVTREPGAAGTATVAYKTLGGTAAAGAEYAPASGTLTFAPGEESKQFDVPVFDDALDEDDKTVYVSLSDEAGGSVGEPALAAVRITDDEPSPKLSIGDARVGEGDADGAQVTFLVTLSEPSPRTITASVTTQAGTATHGIDYAGLQGTYTFPPGSTRGLLKVRVRPDTTAEPDETFTVVLSNAPNAELADGVGVGTIVDDDGAAFTKVRLSASTYSVSEADGRLEVQVTRAGDLSAASSVGYATSDFTASSRSDFGGAAGVLRFAPGEATRTLTVFVNDDRFREDGEMFFVSLFDPRGCTLGAPGGATVNITSDDAADAPSPLGGQADTAFFVRQHYRDFLGREPDAAGLQFWANEIDGCGADAACREAKRVNVSAAFFLSIEFQETGFLAYRTYRAAYGGLVGRPVPIQLFWFLHDAQQIGRDVVVNRGDWRGLLEQNKRDYFDDFVRGEFFTLVYPESVSPAQFVAALDANAGGVLTAGERAALVAALEGGTKTRAEVLRAVAENAELGRREFNRAFVLMQYFGYLRRNPDDAPDANFAGYNFWLGKLEEFGGNYINAEMVKAFISSDEYVQRFGR